MYFDWEDWIGPALAVAYVALIVLVVWAAIEDGKKWDAFKAEHNCKVVQHVRSDVVVGTGVGVMPNGQVGMVTTTSTTPDKTAWACDDGVTYWR